MLRKVLLVIMMPSLLIGVTVLVLIGLRDFDLLVSIATRLIMVAVVIGIPVMIARTIIFPGRPRDGRRGKE